jgi:hypothetical protein
VTCHTHLRGLGGSLDVLKNPACRAREDSSRTSVEGQTGGTSGIILLLKSQQGLCGRIGVAPQPLEQSGERQPLLGA